MSHDISRRHVLGLAGAVAGIGALGGLPTAAASSVAPQRAAVHQLAVYRWGSPKAPTTTDAYASWIGDPTVWGLDFEPSDTWDNISNPGWMLYPWAQWVKAASYRNLVLSVPMLPGAWDLSGPTKGTGAGQAVSLAAGAAGNYNGYFRTLAQSLVSQGMPNAWLRIGWEFNGGWYTWRCSTDRTSWSAYWRQIVTTMRSVAPGLKFIWNPTLGYQQVPADLVYPGDSYVDYIGVDVYDQSWASNTYPWPAGSTAEQIATARQRAWDVDIYGGDHGLQYWATFASQHGKWGVCNRTDGHGGLDNPGFIQNMYNYMAADNVPFAAYFDVNASDGAHQLSPGNDPNGNPVTTEFPNSKNAFLQLFSGGS